MATGATPDDTEREIAGAIRLHIDGLIEDSLPIPEPVSRTAYVDA